MKVIDQTPFRSESGEINLVNRVQGMLKFGASWYGRIQAQDAVAAILGKHLGNQFTLLQNVILPETDIDLPMILLGPPGVLLINSLSEKGIYVARDGEWGTIVDDRFAPERINQVKRTKSMAQVLQIFLERLGHRGFVVEPVMMSSDPALHIDSTRPAIRVVMSDALSRFAISLSQARGIFTGSMVSDLEQAILTGQSKQPIMVTPAFETPLEGGQEGSGELDFAFSEESSEAPADSDQPVELESRFPVDESDVPATKRSPKSRRLLGITPMQWLILGLIVLFWLCSVLVLGGYILYSLGWIRFA